MDCNKTAFQKKGPMPGMCVRLIQTVGILSAFKGDRDPQSSLDGAKLLSHAVIHDARKITLFLV